MTTAVKAEPKGLHAKLAEVMAEADRIPKNGTAPAAMGGFKFVQVGDAADYIRKALGSRGISMLPTAIRIVGQNEHATAKGGTMTTVECVTTWTLTDGETGQQAVIESYGAGADTGDKYSGKAQTNAMKYALLMGFLLSTGDDPEQADTSDRQAHETVEMLGTLQKAGTLQKGGAERYKGEWSEAADGHFIGFRLKLEGDDRDIPQVLIKGSIGEALYLTGASLIGERVTVKGKLFNVRQAGRQSYYRLVVGDHPETDFISSADFRVPAVPEPTVDPAAAPGGSTESTEAPSVPLFDETEQAAVDAEMDRVLGVTA